MKFSSPSSVMETVLRRASRCCGDTTNASESVKITFDFEGARRRDRS